MDRVRWRADAFSGSGSAGLTAVTRGEHGGNVGCIRLVDRHSQDAVVQEGPLARGTRIDAQSSPRAPNFGETGMASLAPVVAIEVGSAALPGRFSRRVASYTA
jgi:hypothetical protein